jgi:hypothetical protein
VDLNGKDPLVDSASEWLRSPPPERRRTTERHRTRRRARKVNNIRARIRLRMWLACTGALLVMAIMLYLALGRERPSESGSRVGGVATVALATAR